MFKNLFDISNEELKKYVSDGKVKEMRDRLNLALKEFVVPKNFSLRCTISDSFLDTILMKEARDNHENLVSKFEEFKEYFEQFKKALFNLDYDEDKLVDDEDIKLDDLQDKLEAMSEAIESMSGNVAFVEKLRILEQKANLKK